MSVFPFQPGPCHRSLWGHFFKVPTAGDYILSLPLHAQRYIPSCPSPSLSTLFCCCFPCCVVGRQKLHSHSCLIQLGCMEPGLSWGSDSSNNSGDGVFPLTNPALGGLGNVGELTPHPLSLLLSCCIPN